jgi:hypothetical protein
MYDSRYLLGKYVRIKGTPFEGEVTIINTRGNIVWVKSNDFGGRSARVEDLEVLTHASPPVKEEPKHLSIALVFWATLILIELILIVTFMTA